MKLTLKVAAHYWQDRTNATWAIADGFDTNILSWFKAKYSMLENNRLEFNEINGSTVFFYYADQTDIYGRNITEITAALAPGTVFSTPRDVHSQIERILKQNPLHELTFTFSIGDSQVIKQQSLLQDVSEQKHGYRWLLAAALVIVFLTGWLIISLFMHKESNIDQIDIKQNDQIRLTKSDYQETQSKDEGIPITNRVQKKLNDIESPSKTSKSEITDLFCQRFKILRYEKFGRFSETCPWIYINSQCSNRDKRMSFNEWAKLNTSVSDCSNLDDISETQMIWMKELTEKDQLLMKRFFAGEN